MRLPPFQWTKVGPREFKWLIKESLNNFYIWIYFTLCFRVFIVVFVNQANKRCNVGSISSPISSKDHNATDNAIAIDNYQSYFRKLGNLFPGKKTMCSKDCPKKFFSCYLNFSMVVRMFKVPTSPSTFSTTWSSLVQQRKKIKNIYKF